MKFFCFDILWLEPAAFNGINSYLVFTIYIFLSIFLLLPFANFIKLLVFFNDFLIHFRLIPIPSISFSFPIQCNIFWDIISCYLFVRKFSSNFSWSFCTLFFFMTHCSTILASSFSKSGGLKSFFATIIPLFKLIFDGRVLLICSIRFSIFHCIPGGLLHVLGCILWHFSFKIL